MCVKVSLKWLQAPAGEPQSFRRSARASGPDRSQTPSSCWAPAGRSHAFQGWRARWSIDRSCHGPPASDPPWLQSTRHWLQSPAYEIKKTLELIFIRKSSLICIHVVVVFIVITKNAYFLCISFNSTLIATFILYTLFRFYNLIILT